MNLSVISTSNFKKQQRNSVTMGNDSQLHLSSVKRLTEINYTADMINSYS